MSKTEFWAKRAATWGNLQMKKSEIRVGGKYTDNKGNIREVVAEGPQYVLYSGQMDCDNLRYRLIAKKRGPHRVGSEMNSTRTSFAAWAKSEVA